MLRPASAAFTVMLYTDHAQASRAGLGELSQWSEMLLYQQIWGCTAVHRHKQRGLLVYSSLAAGNA